MISIFCLQIIVSPSCWTLFGYFIGKFNLIVDIVVLCILFSKKPPSGDDTMSFPLLCTIFDAICSIFSFIGIHTVNIWLCILILLHILAWWNDFFQFFPFLYKQNKTNLMIPQLIMIPTSLCIFIIFPVTVKETPNFIFWVSGSNKCMLNCNGTIFNSSQFLFIAAFKLVVMVSLCLIYKSMKENLSKTEDIENVEILQWNYSSASHNLT